MKNCCIVIPTHKEKLTGDEHIFFINNINKLKNSYDIFLICPNKNNVEYYTNIYKKINIIKLDNIWLSSINMYNKLLCQSFLYELFIDKYDYMLICQTDAVILNDYLDFYIKQDFDYYGAPVKHYNYLGLCGGFSLRKIKTLYNITLKDDYNNEPEDVFFCDKHKNDLRICNDYNLIKNFCISGDADYHLQNLNNEKIMSIHKPELCKNCWEKYSDYLNIINRKNNFVYIHLFPQDFSNNVNNIWTYENLPDYVIKSIYQTYKTNTRKDIYFITNIEKINEKYKNILNKLNVKLIDYKSIYSNDVDFIKEKFNFDLFLLLTFLRFVFCENLMNKFNLQNFIFVEGDNLIYDDFYKLNFLKDSIYICGPISNTSDCSNIIFCNSLTEINKFNKLAYELLQNNQKITDMTVSKFINDKVNIKLFNQWFDDDYLFDPAGLGFYLAGDNHNHAAPYFDENHILSKLLNDNKDKIKIDNNYNLILDNKQTKIVSLHIANKKLIDKYIIYKCEYL